MSVKLTGQTVTQELFHWKKYLLPLWFQTQEVHVVVVFMQVAHELLQAVHLFYPRYAK